MEETNKFSPSESFSFRSDQAPPSFNSKFIPEKEIQTSESSDYQQYRPQKSKKRAIIILLTLVLLTIGLTVGALYTEIWNPSWNPFRPAPDIVLAQMALKMKSLKTAHSQGKIEYSSDQKSQYIYSWKEEDEEPEISYNKNKTIIGFNFDFDKNDLENRKNYLKISMDSSQESGRNSENHRPYFSSSSGDIEVKKIGKQVYFRVNSKTIGEETNFSLNDKWIDFNLDTVVEDLGSVYEDFREESMSYYSEDFYSYYQENQEIEKQEISQEKVEECKEKFLDGFISQVIGKKIYEVKEELPDEKINGQETYHYLLTLKKDEIKRLAADVVSEVIFKYLEECVIDFLPDEAAMVKYYLPAGSAAANIQVQNYIESFFEKTKGIDFEVWIGKKDKYLYKASFKKDLDLVDYYNNQELNKKWRKFLEADLSILIEFNLSDFNKPLDFDAPGDSIKLKDFIRQTVLDSLLSARGKARDARRQSDIRQISLAMEMYYDKDSKYFKSAAIPSAIGTYLDPIPKEPGSSPCDSYQWISNVSNPQKFCVYACLENGKFIISNEKGTKFLDQAPTDLNCGN